jgi:hypothetical protein
MHSDGRHQELLPEGEEVDKLEGTGIIALATAISDMSAISLVNLLLNNIGVDQAEGLVGILKKHPTLKSLCGNKGNETELELSGKMRGAGDASMLVPDIIDNGALTKLDISGNNIKQGETLEQITAICLTKSIELTGTSFDEQDTSEYY